ncbi:hypothetical protein CsSME_00039237 [Camellia sinensis var. sinensis]
MAEKDKESEFFLEDEEDDDESEDNKIDGGGTTSCDEDDAPGSPSSPFSSHQWPQSYRETWTTSPEHIHHGQRRLHYMSNSLENFPFTVDVASHKLYSMR